MDTTIRSKRTDRIDWMNQCFDSVYHEVEMPNVAMELNQKLNFDSQLYSFDFYGTSTDSLGKYY